MSGGRRDEAGGTRGDVLVVVIAALAFATSGPFGKIASPLPAIFVAAARTGLASAVLVGIAPRVFLSAIRNLSRKQKIGVFVAGAFLGAHLALFLAGLGATSLAAAVSLVSLEPLAVVIAAFVAFRLRPARRELSGLVVATVGAVVVASAAGSGDHRTFGDLLVLAGVVFFGAYVASARGLRDAMPANQYAAAVYGAATLVLAPLVLLQLAFAPTPLALAPTNAWLAVGGLALVPTLVGHTLVQRAARHVQPAIVALVCPGETVGSIAIGALFMGTPPTAREALGAALVLAGATLAILKP